MTSAVYELGCWRSLLGRIGLGVGALICALLNGGPALAECDLGICVGDPSCTITGTHLLDDGCTLDFGTRAVTVAGSASLEAAVAGGSFRINAGSLKRIAKLWSLSSRLVPRHIPRGVRRFQTIEDANRERDAWVQRRVDRLRAERARAT